jgi:hypothetical protein
VAVFAGLLLLVWRFLPSPSNILPAPAKPYTLVQTQPLPSSAIVETKSFPLANLIVSSSSVHIIATSSDTHYFRDLDDDQLLELVAPSPVMLVRHAPHIAELVFVNPEDREAFLRD